MLAIRFVFVVAMLSVTMGHAQAGFVFSLNGHYYEAVTVTGGWESANTVAHSMTYNGVHGYLATITSQAENDFITSHFPVAVSGRYWLGGYQDVTAPDYSEPAGGWRWVTGEMWSFTTWTPGEPNNDLGDERYLLFAFDGKWNDGKPTDLARPGFVVEFSPATVPEPTSLTLAGFAVLGMAARAWRRQRQQKQAAN